jgi:hypothetical protein
MKDLWQQELLMQDLILNNERKGFPFFAKEPKSQMYYADK